MFLELIPLDDFDAFQRKMRVKKFLHKKVQESGRYLSDKWNEKPYSPIKPDDMPLDKYLESKRLKDGQ